MPITDSIGQLIEGVSFVFGRLCSCHSVIALGGQFSWNWSKVAVNRDLLNVERAVWFPVFWTCHRPHHVSGVRGPGNGSLFFRWIAYVIYSGSCLIPLRRSPKATANTIGTDRVTPHGINQMHLVRWQVITHNILFRQFVLFKHHCLHSLNGHYPYSIVWATHGHVGTTVIIVTHP